MPRNVNTVKAANLLRRKPKAKVIEWETQVHSRGIRDVPVEVSASGSQPRPRKTASRRPRAQNDDMLQGETVPQPMDVDETFWVEEPKSHISPSLSTPTLKNLSPRLTPTYAAYSIMRAFRRRLHARVASLLRSSGGAPTAFLHSYSARSAAESHTSYFLFTESKNGLEHTSCHRGYGRLGCAYNLGTLGIHARIKL